VRDEILVRDGRAQKLYVVTIGIRGHDEARATGVIASFDERTPGFRVNETSWST
jgi:hypothetical protein